MECKIVNGDYQLGGQSDLTPLRYEETLLQRALIRLTVRRGSFPFMPALGSDLWRLGRARRDQRASLAQGYVAQALALEEELSLQEVSLREDGQRLWVSATLTVKEQTVRLEVLV